MKKYSLLIMWLIAIPAISQKDEADINHKMVMASQYFNGILRPMDKEKSFELYLECANTGNSKAMNAVGVQLKQGAGTGRSYTEAFKWFKKAADAGNSQAWFNLGLSYKMGEGCELDYDYAYECFKKSSESGNLSGNYGLGYMLYKGLGCTQNYSEAFAIFKKGADMGSPSCMYFLGLCYRNGYGTSKNEENAIVWLKKSAKRGYAFATDEMMNNRSENYAEAEEILKTINNANGLKLPNKYVAIPPPANKLDFTGSYKGYLLKYDYSGKHLLSCTKIMVDLIKNNDGLVGQWVEDDTLRASIKANIVNNEIVFENTQYIKSDRYSLRNPALLSFEKASMNIVYKSDSILLSGNISFFSTKAQEPEKPTTVLLFRTSESAKSVYNFEAEFSVFPNPFVNNLFVEFNLAIKSQVSIQMYSADGKLVFTNQPTTLEKGRYKLPIQLNVARGQYIIKLVSGNKTFTKKAIKI